MERPCYALLRIQGDWKSLDITGYYIDKWSTIAKAGVYVAISYTRSLTVLVELNFLNKN